MPFMDLQSLLTVFVILFGCGLYLRMVAKEKRRREKHLELRLIRKNYAEVKRQEREEKQAATAQVVTVAQVLPVNVTQVAAA
jgi:hypothetical protein